MELIRDLIRFLSDARLTVEDIVARIGPVVRDAGGLAPIELRPQITGAQAARVARFPGSDAPYFLDLQFVPNARPLLGAITAHLGEFKLLLTDRNHPTEVIFYPPIVGKHWQIAVIAQLTAAEDPDENAPVTRMIFRRDFLVAPTLSAPAPGEL